jgi:integrase
VECTPRLRQKNWGQVWPARDCADNPRDWPATAGRSVHDFRHRFAIRTLLGWYREGIDVEQRLPALSTYLGHDCVRDTYWYLSGCPELMEEAMRRLDRRWEAKP